MDDIETIGDFLRAKRQNGHVAKPGRPPQPLGDGAQFTSGPFDRPPGRGHDLRRLERTRMRGGVEFAEVQRDDVRPQLLEQLAMAVGRTHRQAEKPRTAAAEVRREPGRRGDLARARRDVRAGSGRRRCSAGRRLRRRGSSLSGQCRFLASALTSAAVYLTLGALLMRIAEGRLAKYYCIAIAMFVNVGMWLDELRLNIDDARPPIIVLVGTHADCLADRKSNRFPNRNTDGQPYPNPFVEIAILTPLPPRLHRAARTSGTRSTPTPRRRSTSHPLATPLPRHRPRPRA